MIPVEHFEKDDCLRCAVASILEMKGEDVPHFVKKYPGGTWWEPLQEWLAERGKTIKCFMLSGGLSYYKVPRKHWIAVVHSSNDEDHAVVMYGRKAVHQNHKQRNTFKYGMVIFDNNYRQGPWDWR